MGLLDQVVGALGQMSEKSDGNDNALLNGLMNILNNPQTGGLSGLIESFQKNGLGDVVASWISTGQNLPVSADQIQNVLNGDQLQQLASQLGLSTGQASGQLADLLPQIIDKLTPSGAVPQNADLMTQGLELLKGKFFN